RLVFALQGLTARWSGHVLDALAVTHVRTGNVLELPGQRLAVEPVCSGIQALTALFTGTWLFILWVRRPLVQAVCLLACAGLWAVALNVVRVTAVTWLMAEA